MDDSISFGQWVRRRRKALDLTQEELARRVACSLAMVKKIEADARRPSVLMAERLAGCLHISPESRPAFIQSARLQRSPDRLPPAHELPPTAQSPPPRPAIFPPRSPVWSAARRSWLRC